MDAQTAAEHYTVRVKAVLEQRSRLRGEPNCLDNAVGVSFFGTPKNELSSL